MLKKILIGVLVIFILIVTTVIAIPVFFKGKIIAFAKEKANENLEATLYFDPDIGLSLFKNFPDFTLTVEELSIANHAPFEGDTLFYTQKFEATIDLMSILKSDDINLKAITLQNPYVHVIENKDGMANYDIAKATDDTKASAEEEASSGLDLKFELQQLNIHNGRIIYDSKPLSFLMALQDFNHEMKGDFSLSVFHLATTTTALLQRVHFDGVDYVNDMELALEAGLKMDLDEWRFEFLENELQANAFKMSFDGVIGMPEEGIFTDVQFKATDNTFKSLLSIVPLMYQEDFADLKSDGNLNFDGMASGLYSDTSMPGFEVNLNVAEGMFQYPDLPMALRNFSLEMHIKSLENDAYLVDIPNFAFSLDEEPFEGMFKLNYSENYSPIITKANGTINFGNVRQLLPLPKETKLGGTLTTDILFEGDLVALEAEVYDDVVAEGNIALKQFKYHDADLPLPVEIPTAELFISPQKAQLKAFELKMEQNQLFAEGEILHLMDYVFTNHTLQGNFKVTSPHFDFNPFMAEGEEVEQTPEADKGAPLTAVAIPRNLDFTLDAQFKHLIFDNMEFEHLVGIMTVKDGVLSLKDGSMDFLGGQLLASGSYNSQDPQEPIISFDLGVKSFDIASTFQTFEMVEKFAPIVQKANGQYGGSFSFSTHLKNDFSPIFESFHARADFNLQNTVLEGAESIQKINNALKTDQFRTIELHNVALGMTIEEGRMHVDPMNFKVNRNEVIFSGSSGLDQTLDFILSTSIPTGNLQQKASSLANQILGGSVDVSVSDRLNIDLLIGGTFDDVKIKPRLSEVFDKKNLKNQLRDEASRRAAEAKRQAEEALRKEKEALEQRRREEEERARAAAEEKRKAVEQRKKEEEERLRREAEAEKERLRKEAEEQRKKQEEKAKEELRRRNPLRN